MSMCVSIAQAHTKRVSRDWGPAFFLYISMQNGSFDMSMWLSTENARATCSSQSWDLICVLLCALICVLSYVCSSVLSSMCSHLCAPLCSHMRALICVPMAPCALICVLSSVCSYVLSYMCAPMCSHVCSYVLSSVCSYVLSYVCSHDTVSDSTHHTVWGLLPG